MRSLLNGRVHVLPILIAAIAIASGALLVARSAPVHAEGSATLTLGKTLIGEGNDFATQELGIPWDMKTGPYPGPTTVFKRDVDLNSLQVVNGRWKFTSMDTDGGGTIPLVWMHWTSIDDTQEVLRLGDRYPINTDKYKMISFYFCSEQPEFGVMFWFYTKAPHSPSDPSKTAFSDVPIAQGCNFYSLDMTQYPVQQGAWAKTSQGYPMGIRFSPQLLSNSSLDFELDWFRITSRDTSNVVPLNWSGVTPGAKLHFYASRTGCGGEAIPLGTQNTSGSNGTFQWGSTVQYISQGRAYALPEALEPGFYTIYMLENNTGAPICSTTQLEIRAAPLITINKPSMLSGPDYASTVLNDTWGFANSDDVIKTQDIVNISYDNGLFNGRTNGEGVWLLLNDDSPNINTNKYKYASYRMDVQGNQTLSGGWIARYYWWNIGPGFDASGTKGQVVFEGWHTYSMDLSKALMLDSNAFGWTGTPNGFRFDPLEPQSTTQYNFSIDFVTLTGDEIVNSGQPFEVIVDVVAQSSTSMTLYYDTDTNPNNGRTPLAIQAPTYVEQGGSAFSSFLPVLFNGPTLYDPNELPPLPGQSVLWDTSGVPPGSYYISADVTDGVNTSTWYSEIPVIIK